MNKRLWFVLFSTLILGTLFTFNSCQIGLGASVDVESPVVEITYPPASAVIKGTFTFAGTCSDDKGVTSAKVTVTNSDIDKSYGTYNATVASDGLSWSVSLNAASTADGSVNGWSYPDGSYEISIVAYDSVGHSSGVSSRAFEIDNTPPVLILSKPLAYGSDSPTKYGRTLKIAGDIGEQHTVGTPVVHVYQYADSKLTKTTDLSVSNFSTMSSDNPLVIAKYYTTDEIAAQTNTSTKAEMQNLRDAYLSIYGSEADNATTSDKTYYCGIELFDNARTYIDPSDSGTGSGNASTEYYINTDGFNSALISDKSEYKLTVKKLMNILNGTDSEFTSEQKVAIKGILKTAGNFASSTSVSATASSTFSVNPANNPTWKINDYAIGEANNSKATTNDHRDYALGSTVYLVLSSGRDGIYVKPSTVSVQLQQYTYTVNNGKLEWTKKGEPIPILKAGAWTDDADTTATHSFAFTSDYKDVNGNDCGFASGQYYRFVVSGEDRDQNTLSPENNVDYGLLIKSSHNPPEVDFYTPANVDYTAEDKYYSADSATGSTYLVGATIPVRVHTDGLEMSGTNPLSVSFPDGSGITYSTAFVSKDSNYYYYTITITGAGTPSSTSDKLKYSFTATATDADSGVGRGTAYFYIDNKKPTVNFTTVSPYVSEASGVKTVNGDVTFSGTVSETNKPATKKVTYTVTKIGANAPAITDTVAIQEDDTFSFKLDTTKLTDETKYIVAISMKDDVGNSSVESSKTIYIDQSTDAPVISLSNAKTTITADNISKTNGNLFNTSDNNKLLGAVSDDDGIQSIIVTATDLGTNSAVTMTQPTFTAGSTTASLSCELPSAEGKYQVVFTVVDTKYADTTDENVKALRTSTATYYVAVDKGAPIFNKNTASGAYTAASTAKSVTGTASDSNGIYSIIRYSDSTYSTIETSWINGTSNSITYNTTSGAWTDTIAATIVGTAGATKYYEAADVYGNTTRLEFTYKVDALSPTFTITQLGSTTVNLTGGSSTADANYALSENVYQVKGTVTDPGASDVSGVKGIYYYIVPTGSAPTGATAYAPVTGSTTNTGWNVCSTTIGNSSITWTANISLDGVADSAGNAITEGTTYVVYIAAVDEAGNVSVIASNPSKVVQIIPDANVPSTTLTVESGTLYRANGTTVTTGGTITTDSTYYASGEVKIAGTITETNFDSTYYSVTKNSAPVSGQVTPVFNGTKSWSFTRTAAANNTDDGTYAYALGIYDKAGRSNVYSFTIIVDTKVPTLEVTSPATNEAVAVATKNLKGTASDSGSGIQSVTYTLYNADETKIIQNNLTNITGNAVLTGESWAVNSMPLGSSEGSLKLKVVATDNLSHSTTTWVPFYYDKSNPELEETTVGDSGKILNTSTVTLGGTASDTNALVGSGENAVVVTETVSGTTTTVKTVSVTSGSWSASLIGVSDGKHTYTVTATDAAGKTTSKSRVVTVDTTTPSVTTMTITNTKSATISSVDWYNVATITAHVVAADTGTGVASVEYSTDYTAASPSTATWNTMTNKSTYWTGNITCSEGTNKVYFRVTDVAGNTNTFTNSGNWLSFGVDTVSPAATLTSVDGATLSGTKLVNGNTAVTVVMNATDSTTGIKSVALKTKIGASTASTSSPVTTGTSGSYTFTIAKADLGTGNAVFTVTDNAGNAADFNLFAMLLDNTAPTATINVPTDADTTAAGTQVNKTISLTGIAGDNQALADTAPITIEYQTGASTWATLGTSTGTTSWTLSGIDTTSAFTTVYDSDGSTAGTQVSIRAKVTDKAGNTGYSTSVPLTVDQNSDRPVIKLSNILVAGTSKLKMSSTVYGTVTDDDGVSNFYYTTKSGIAPTASATEDPTTGWTTIPLSSGTWNVSSGSDGTTTLYFKVVDAAGTTFTTNNSTSLTRPYTIDSAITKSDASSDNTTGIKFQSDSSAPVIVNTTTDKWGIFSSKTKYTTSDATAVKGLTYSADDNYDTGGANKYLYVYVHAKDANGIKSITVNLNSATIASTATTATVIATETITETDGTQGTKVYFGPIDMSAYTSANTPLTVTATDNFDLSTPSSRNILIDNDAPTVSMIYPLSTQRMSTGFSATGTVSDNAAGTGVKSIKWMIPTVAAKSGITVDSTGWNEIGTTAAWTIAFISSDIKTYGTSTYGTETTAGSGIYNVSLYFRVEDIAGNANVITTNTMRFDPDADKPVADVIYPATSDPLTNLGGTIRAYGTASDNVSVASVQMQMDVNGDGSFDETDYNLIKGWKTAGYTAYTGLSTSYTDASSWYFTVSGTTNWNIALNANKELDAYKSNTNGLGIRVRAYDDDDNTRAWSVIQRFKIDTDVPEFGSTIKIQLVRFNGTAIASTLDYSTGMWISDYENGTKNPWYLYGTVEDDSGITAIEFANQTGYGTLNYTLAANSGYFTAGYTTDGTSWTAGTPASGTTVVRKGYLLKVPLEMARANSDGAIKSIITIYDGTSPNPVKNTSNIQINIDNTAPAMEYTTAGNKATLQLKQGTDVIGTSHTVTNSNGSMFTFGDSVTETGSGFSRLVFYYERVPATTSATNPARVYNPMESSSNRTDLTYNIGSKESDGYYADGSFYINDDGLPVLIIKNGSNIVTRSNTTSLTATRLVNNKNVRIGGLVKIAGVYRRIDSVTTSTGTITFSPGVDTSYTTAEVVYGLVVDHLTTESLSGTTVINDDGDGMVEILSQTGGTYNWKASIDSQNIKDGSIQIHCVSFDAAGNCEHGYVTTSVQNNRPRLTKVFLGTDLSGNNTYDFAATTDETPTAGTEYGEFCYYPTTDTTDGVYTTTLASSAFIAKSGLAIVPEFVGSGDNGALSYILTHNKDGTTAITSPATTSSGTLVALTTASSSITGTSATTAMTVTGKGYIPLTTTDLITICKADSMDGSADKEMLQFSIWDQTEETTQGVDSQWAIINVPLIVDVVDKAAPYAHVHPFYWNNASDNSLYGNSAANGHIELEGDLSDSFSKTGTTVYDLDPKVSGKIRIVGDAYDETKLTKIELKIDDMALGGTAGAWTTLATYSPGAWTKNAAAGAMVSAFSVTDPTGPTQHGHKVTWELDVDTSKIANVAGADKVILVRATDGGSNVSKVDSTTNTTSSTVYATNSEAINGNYYSTAALAASAGTADVTLTADITPIKGDVDATYTTVYEYTCAKTPYYRVDVVPYITGVKTSLSTIKKSKSSVYDRTALGHYPVKADLKAYFYGFNLAASATVSDSSSGTVTLGAVDTTTFTGYTVYPAAVAGLKSGNVTITVNSTPSLNNVNKNAARGTYAQTTTSATGDYTVYSNYYNRQPNGDNNNNLTDDVVLDIWTIKNSARSRSGTLTEPVMRIPASDISSTNDVMRFAFTNGAEYFSMAPASSTTTSYRNWERNYADFNNVAFAYDSQGNSYGITTGLDTYPDGTSTLAGRFTFISSRWGTCNTGSRDDNYYGFHKLRLEAIGIMKGAYIQGAALADNYVMDTRRFNSPVLATAVHGGTGTNASTAVYLAYYDKFQKQIRFRYGAFTTGTATPTSGDSNSNTGFDQYVDQHAQADANYQWSDYTLSSKYAFDASLNDYSLIAGKDAVNPTTKDTGNTAGKYVAIDVVPGTTIDADVVVAVWYDGEDLKYSYKLQPNTDYDADQTHTATAGYWSPAQTIFTNGGKYCAIKVDVNGGIHIAAQDSINQDLKYAYLSKYNATYSESANSVTVDSYAIVGTQVQIDTELENGKVIPYISYYNGATEKPKMAYLVPQTTMNYAAVGSDSSTEMFTGNWEVTLIPTSSEVQDDHINIGLWKTTAGVQRTTVGTGTESIGTNSGTAYGNGTGNAVVGYATVIGTQGYIETAQKQ
jgi:hypothetical protein